MLTRADLQAIKEVFDSSFDQKFDQAFDRKFPASFDQAFDRKFPQAFKDAFISNIGDFYEDVLNPYLEKRFNKLEIVTEDHEKRIKKLEKTLTTS